MNLVAVAAIISLAHFFWTERGLLQKIYKGNKGVVFAWQNTPKHNHSLRFFDRKIAKALDSSVLIYKKANVSNKSDWLTLVKKIDK